MSRVKGENPGWYEKNKITAQEVYTVMSFNTHIRKLTQKMFLIVPLLAGIILLGVCQSLSQSSAPPPRGNLGEVPVPKAGEVKLTRTVKSRSLAGNPSGIGPVNNRDRAAVVRLYKTKYAPYIKTANGWTGSVSGCRPGNNSVNYDNATLILVNYFRVMAGLAGDITFRSDYNKKAIKAALIMEAKWSLSHSPPRSWPCYTSEGAKGAGSSNLCLNCVGPYAINAYIDDRGVKGVGHRNWVLAPGQKVMGTGSTKKAHALYVFGEWKKEKQNIPHVAWPPAGYVPYKFGLDRGYPWSFNIQANPVDSSRARVRMTHKGRNIALKQEAGRFSNIVWYPAGLPKSQRGYGAYKPEEDYVIDVTIENVKVKGKLRSYSYRVTFIDPARSAPSEEPEKTDEVKIDPSLSLALIRKVYAGDSAAVKSLLSRGADPNAKYKGWSALMFAAYFGHQEIVTSLLARKADPNYAYNNWNPLGLARYRKHTKVISLLEGRTRDRGVKPRSIVRPPGL